jgi:poly-gamma-glutamate synthesis protein (capsule biosynthesis protein)
LQEKWFSADIRVFNLETPLVNSKSPIIKNGPNLIAPTETINGILKLNSSLILLANNHIMDQGKKGFKSTVTLLNEKKIPYIGAGRNIDKAKKPYIIEKQNKKIGIYACAEHEFTIAKKDSAGANPFDPLESLDHIKALKDKSDYVIVIYHGGKEHYRYPSPNLQKTCRKMVEKGADLVLCQHSHCIGSFEKYNDSIILYGQGNFIFNMKNNEYWNTGLLVKVNIDDKFEVEYIPLKTTNTGIKAVKDKKEFLSNFYNRSEKINNHDFVANKYKEFSKKKIRPYLRSLNGLGKWFSRIDRIIFNGWLINKLYDKDTLVKLLNFIECEAHRELLIEGIKNSIEKGNKG